MSDISDVSDVSDSTSVVSVPQDVRKTEHNSLAYRKNASPAYIQNGY